MKSLKKRFEVLDADASHPLVENEVSEIDTNTRRPARWGVILLVLGFGGFMLWAALAPLDAGVSSPGLVKVANNRKTIQHLTGGKVDEILVREGEIVRAGQVLIKLNPVQTAAQLGMSEAQFISAKAVESRLMAERDGKIDIILPPELQVFSGNERLKSAVALQESLFRARHAAQEGEIQILQENLAATAEQLRGLEQVRLTQQQQLTLLNEQLTGMREMARDGYVPRNRVLELERAVSQLNGSLAESIANVGRTRNQMAELKLRMLQRRQEFQKEVQSQLTEVQKEANAQADRLGALRYEMANIQIRSPIDGMVVGLNVHTVGGVIQQGLHIMDVVPLNQPMIIEAQVAPHLIDKLHSGLAVDINFPAFSHAQTPTIPGVVDTVSADRLTDERTNMTYYLVQVKVAPEGVKLLGKNQIRPGMPVEVIIKTGERTMLNYLLKPLLARMESAFTGQ